MTRDEWIKLAANQYYSAKVVDFDGHVLSIYTCQELAANLYDSLKSESYFENSTPQEHALEDLSYWE